MTLTQILQKIRSAFYTKAEINAMGGGSSLDETIKSKADANHNHNSVYLGITAKAESSKSADSVAWANVSGKPSSYTPSSHTHDDRYYTESEMNTKLSGKSDTSHNHNSVYLGINAKASSATSADNGVDSFGASWIRFKNGVQICWIGGCISGNSTAFPKAFSSATTISIVATYNGNTNDVVACKILTYNKTNFTVLAQKTDSTWVNSSCVIAIGLWK